MKKLKGKVVGEIDISALNVPPEKHEFDTAKYFAELGYNIEFIKPRYIKGQKNPDFRMNGKMWETKSPTKYSNATFEFNLKKAMKQSDNIIFDLRRLKEQDETLYLKNLVYRAKARKIKSLIVITRDDTKLDIKGRV